MTDVIIYIKRDKVKGNTQSKRKGPLPNQGGAEWLPGPKQGGPLNFYDMGRKWNGSTFADFATTHFDPAYTFIDAANHAFFRATADPNLTAMDALRAEVIDYTITDIETKHPRIGNFEGDFFEVWLGDSSRTAPGDPEWSDRGWSPTQAELDAITDFQIGANNRFLEAAILTGSSKNHITSTYNPADPAVAYGPQLGDKFFMMPTLVRPEGYAMYTHVVSGSTVTVVAVDLYDSQVIPRTPLLDSSGPFYLTLVNNDFEWDGVSGSTSDYADNHKSIEFFQSFAVGNVRKDANNDGISFVSFAWNSGYTGSGFPPTAFFPSSTTPPAAGIGHTTWMLHGMATYGTIGSQELTGIVSVVDWTRPTGTLLAVIKRGTSLFYVWK